MRKRGKAWELFVELPRGPDGKRRRRTCTVHGARRDAEKKLREILRSLDTNTYVAPTRTTLGEFLESWFADHLERNLERRTIQRYSELTNRYVVPTLGSVPLQALQPAQIQAMYTTVQRSRDDGGAGLKGTTALQIHRLLRKSLQHALRLGLVVRNCADAVQPPRARHAPVRVLDSEQVRRLLVAAADTPLEIPILIAIGAGLRRGEALALAWDNVNFETAALSIVRSLGVAGGEVYFKSPKTQRGVRQVVAPQFLLQALRKQRTLISKQKLRLGPAFEDNGLVCPRSNGKPQNVDTFSSMYRKFVLRLDDVPQHSFHGLRHSHASLMLQANQHMKVVSERLGHASISVTVDTYSHLYPGMQSEAADKLDELFRSSE